MRKIAIVTRKLIPGGIEKSLISMVNEMCNLKYDVTVFVVEQGGEFERDIPSNVTIKPIFKDNIATKKKVVSLLLEKKIIKAVSVIKNIILSNFTKNIYKSMYYPTKNMEVNKELYDLVISYHSPISFSAVYSINNIKSVKKAIWIHTELEKCKKELIKFKKLYNEYDMIFAVSNGVKKQFIDIFPEYKNKVDIYYNSISIKEIREKAKENIVFNYEKGAFKIVTVGRLSNEKGQDLIPYIIKKLNIKEIKVNWYLIESGELRTQIEENAKKCCVEDSIIYLGNKKNPYPYIEMCDIYVQPSREESFGLTISEAKCLCKPIVATNTIGAREQIQDGFNGLLSEHDVKTISDKIINLIEDKELLNKLIINLSNEDINKSDEIRKIEYIIS